MKTIWKYELPGPAGHFEIDMQKGAKILCLQMQKDTPVIWALVDTEAAKETRKFVMYGTGHEIDKELLTNYVGTFQLEGGYLVMHVFEAL